MYEFDPAPPTTVQRIVAGVMVLVVLVPNISNWAHLNWFAGYDAQVAGIATLAGIIWYARCGPRVKKAEGGS